jgi:hypothetical protein
VIVLFSAGMEQCGSKLGSAVVDLVPVPGGGEESGVAQGEQVP